MSATKPFWVVGLSRQRAVASLRSQSARWRRWSFSNKGVCYGVYGALAVFGLGVGVGRRRSFSLLSGVRPVSVWLGGRLCLSRLSASGQLRPPLGCGAAAPLRWRCRPPAQWSVVRVGAGYVVAGTTPAPQVPGLLTKDSWLVTK